MRGLRKALSEEQKAALRARAYVASNIKRGRIERQPCEVSGCQARPLVYHRDFGRPLEVSWLCKEHAREQGLVGPIRPGINLPESPCS
jgi:hypothetical protein